MSNHLDHLQSKRRRSVAGEVVQDWNRATVHRQHPRFDWRHPFQSLRRGQTFAENEADAEQHDLDRERQSREYRSGQDIEADKAEADVERMYRENNAVEELARSIGRTKARRMFMAAYNIKNAVFVSTSLIRVLESTEQDSECKEAGIAGIRRKCKSYIADQELSSLGGDFDPYQPRSKS